MGSVAPPAGAWIETYIVLESHQTNESHPLRVRGLKRVYVRDSIPHYLVAPPAGAWIETCSFSPSGLRLPSHPLRVRGLKQHPDR